MIRIILALLLLACSGFPALAQEFSPPVMGDPLVRQLICTTTPEWSNEGPAYSRATIFSVPEPDGRGERLYVGFVDDLWDRSSPARLWRGPVAARWHKLGPVPEYKANLKAKNPRSFRVARLTPPNPGAICRPLSWRST